MDILKEARLAGLCKAVAYDALMGDADRLDDETIQGQAVRWYTQVGWEYDNDPNIRLVSVYDAFADGWAEGCE